MCGYGYAVSVQTGPFYRGWQEVGDKISGNDRLELKEESNLA